MTNPTIRVRIDELMLEGFATLDRAAIGAAAQAELARLLTEQGAPTGLESGTQTHIMDAGAFDLAANAGAATIGAEIARAVYGGLNR